MDFRARCVLALLLLPAFPALAAHAAARPPAAPRVKTASGLVEGVPFGTSPGATAFLGIPYAAPPTGEWRWKPARPVEPWVGVRAARKLGPSCSQAPDRFPNFMRTIVTALGADPSVVPPLGPTNEDCLSLSAWTANLGGRPGSRSCSATLYLLSAPPAPTAAGEVWDAQSPPR